MLDIYMIERHETASWEVWVNGEFYYSGTYEQCVEVCAEYYRAHHDRECLENTIFDYL